ncbi:chloride channel protein 2-like [Daphnia pulicaria]|uniref:chloride channel protein 2-like n=1 Tax=Daphnia pulicaria TaxID=35523 RepID=UPI001EE9BF99|nr:chloride channel protein 2-like [Daphnia pulicaria]
MATAEANDNNNKSVVEMGYETTLMYGQYSRSLGDYAKEQAAQLRQLEKKSITGATIRRKELQTHYGKWFARFIHLLKFIWSKTFAKIGEDWAFLAILGIIMALLSFTMDLGIYMCFTARMWMYNEFTIHPAVQYMAWITLPVTLVLFAAGFVFIVSPQAVGSGIPEMKTIMRGVVLKEYLTFPTLIAKTVGLTAALGSGMPLGKEGPLVHIGSIVGTLLSQLLTSFKGIYENESRKTDMLAAACAVGVSCSLGAPIGGVLFSIEVTSVYFAIRNYWRGFFSAVFSALMFRLLAYWSNSEETLTTVFPTSFQVDFPYDPHELFIFALVGVFGGLSGAVFVLFHRRYVLFMRNNTRISSFLKYNRFIYPSIVSVLIASLFYPSGFGRYLATTLSTKQQVGALFANFTWLSDDLSVEQAERLSHWDVANTNLFVGLGIFMSANFFLSILASTLPVPTGSLIPIFKVGAAFGRMIGEAMYLWFPEGIQTGGVLHPILPGGYAIVGAAAFSAGVTHTVSISVVVAEMTGQIQHIIPVLVAVIVSNAISTLLQPSLYESIIMIKKLPYLPNILPSRSAIHSIFVEDFMNRNVKYIWHGITFGELKNLIADSQGIRSFPLLGDTEQKILLGSVQRVEVIALLERHIGEERRLEVVAKRHMETRKRLIRQRAKLATTSVDPLPTAAPTPAPLPAPLPISRPEVPVVQEPVRRKVSRFEVITSPNVVATVISETGTQRSGVPSEPPVVTHPLSDPLAVTRITVEPDDKVEFQQSCEPQPQRRIKSILKRTNSFTFPSGERPKPAADLSAITTYSTVTGAEGSKFRNVIETILRPKPSDSNDVDKFSFFNSMTSMSDSPPSFRRKGSLSFKNKERSADMSPEEKEAWEEKEMLKKVDFNQCLIDPAPFQLVERTSLLKVHSIFSLLGVHHAYVTTLGKLVGIVSLTELRKAIEDVNSGVLLGASAQSTGNVSSEQSIEEVAQSTTEKESEIVSQPAPDTENYDSLTTASSRHVKFMFLRRLSVSPGSEMTDINVSEGRSSSPASNSRSDNQP